MHKDRLIKLAELLEADADNEEGLSFNLNTWVSSGGEWFDEDWKPGLNCGTAGCALGLAALSGAFHEHGLRVIPRDNIVYLVGQPHLQGFDAGARLFGITSSMSHDLFSPTRYFHTKGAEAERIVAQRIRFLVEDRPGWWRIGRW